MRRPPPVSTSRLLAILASIAAFRNGTLRVVWVRRGRWGGLAQATREVVQREVGIGLEIVSDGEYGKASYASYVKERLTGFDGEPRRTFGGNREYVDFPDWVRSSPPRVTFPSNNGPV